MKFSSTKSRTVAVLASLGLALTGFSTSALGAQNEIPSADRMIVKADSWDPRNLPGDDPKRWLFGMTFQGGQNPMTPSPMIVDDLGNRFCDNLSDSCGESERLRLRGYAPECQGRELVSVCVNTLELKLENGDWVRGRILRTLSTAASANSIAWFENHLKSNPQLGEVLQISMTKSWSENPTLKAPASGEGPILFEVPGLTNAAVTSLYLLDVQFEANVFPKAKSTTFGQFNISLYPVKLLEDSQTHRGVDYFHKLPNGEVKGGGTGPVFHGADFQFDGAVAYSARFPLGSEARVKLEIPQALGGWFHSRLSAPEFELSSGSRGQNILTVSGKPAEVPITNVFVQGTDPKFKDIVSEDPYWLEYHKQRELAGDFAGVSGGLWTPNEGTENFKKWLPYMSDTAKGSAQTWLVSRMPTERLGNNRCLSDTSRIQGLINTNAMVYQSEIPRFVDGYLTYEVAGVHNSMTGQLNLGEYDLKIRSETARCLYGYSKAPVNASVQVLSDNGAPVVATTQVAERDGWLSLAAYGFTFSEKEVRVTLSQDSQPRKVSFNLSKFETKSSKLSSGQMSSIRQAFANTPANTKATCTALYVKASDKNLALNRAKNACAYVNQISPALKVTSVAKPTKTKGLDGRVTVVSQ